MSDQPNLINGGFHQDERGTVSYVNDFIFEGVKRFYLIEHPDVLIVRAWQGHKFEQKWFYVVKGTFELSLVKPDNWETPSPTLSTQRYLLSEQDNKILHIPGGFATGFRALEPHSRMIVYSDKTIQESQHDDFRFDKSLWYK